MSDESKAPVFTVKHCNIFAHVLSLFGSEEVVDLTFDTQNNQIKGQSLILNHQAVISFTFNDDKVLGPLRCGDGSVKTLRFDSKTLNLMLAHAKKNRPTLLNLAIYDDHMKVAAQTKNGNTVSQHIIRSIMREDENSSLVDISELIDSLEYTCKAKVDSEQFGLCMNVDCEETQIERKNCQLHFSTNHISLESTMILSLQEPTSNEAYAAKFGKTVITFLKKLVAIFSTDVGSKRGINAEPLTLYLSSEDPLGIHGKLQSSESQLHVYVSSRAED